MNTNSTIDKEDIKLKVHEFVRENNRMPTLKDIDKLNPITYSNVVEYYGTFHNLILDCDFCIEGNIYNSGYSQEFLIYEIKRFHEEFGIIPTTHKLNDYTNNYPSGQTFVNHFGTLNNAIKAAGFRPTRFTNITNEELIDLLYDYQDEFGKVPTMDEIYKDKHYPSLSLYVQRFGSWKNALSISGLTK